jgi:hypothetical protein
MRVGAPAALGDEFGAPLVGARTGAVVANAASFRIGFAAWVVVAIIQRRTVVCHLPAASSCAKFTVIAIIRAQAALNLLLGREAQA